MVVGVDGCSAPNYGVPLPALATAFARLTRTAPDAIYGQGPTRIAAAMSSHPEMVSGEGRNDLILTRAGRGDWVCKVGADGVQAIASRSRGVAVTAKVGDGNLQALMVAVTSVLEQLGWLDDSARAALAEFSPPPMKNYGTRRKPTVNGSPTPSSPSQPSVNCWKQKVRTCPT